MYFINFKSPPVGSCELYGENSDVCDDSREHHVVHMNMSTAEVWTYSEGGGCLTKRNLWCFLCSLMFPFIDSSARD